MISIHRSLPLLALGASLLLVGCESPMHRTNEQMLRESLRRANQAYLEATAPGDTLEIKRTERDVVSNLAPERRAELEKMSGPDAYAGDKLGVGEDLLGNEQSPTISMTLEQAIRLTVKNNVEVRGARLLPAINEAQVIQAEAAFDAALFASIAFNKEESLTPPGPTGFGRRKDENGVYNFGIRKQLTTGGRFTAESTVTHTDQTPSFLVTPTFYNADISLTLEQPLLRNFGSDVNRAQIELAKNTRRSSVQDLRNLLLQAVSSAEQAYWNLVFARQRLLVLQRLLERTEDDRDKIAERRILDATAAQLTEANSFVESRRADVIRARQDIRRASDALKRLIDADDLPLTSETLILPIEKPLDVPISYSLLDAITTALQKRPEIRQALLDIDSASIRHRVADNQLLPILDVTATVRYAGLGQRFDKAYDNALEGGVIDYLLGAQFEAPIGNRFAQAVKRQRMIEMQSATLNYRSVMQDVVLEVKNALRDVRDQYELISAERAARLAAAENLRNLAAQEDAGTQLSPEFLDLKLRRQEALANAELREFQALTDYNTAINALHFATGTLLERNGIDFKDPEADE